MVNYSLRDCILFTFLYLIYILSNYIISDYIELIV